MEVTLALKKDAGGVFVPYQLLIAFSCALSVVCAPSWLPEAAVVVLPTMRELEIVGMPAPVTLTPETKTPPPPMPSALPLLLFAMVEFEIVVGGVLLVAEPV